MELINFTRMPADVTVHTDVDGREVLVVVVKGTFVIPRDASALRLHEEQQPLVMSDVYYGEPGKSAPKYEVDFAPRKLRCDLLLNATAWAPAGRPATRVPVGVAVGNWSKTFDVVGDRAWEAGIAGPRPGRPRPFVSKSITYDCAFGGTDTRSENPKEHAAYMANPTGVGFHRDVRPEWVVGSPLPNTEETGQPVKAPNESYQPMSFGVLGRHWDPRREYAGTYNRHWLEHVFPFLPEDFDDRYFQAAPPDQQLPKAFGEMRVALLNLTPDGARDFVIPAISAPIFVCPRRGGREEYRGELDTVVIEPDVERVTLTWRVARLLRRSIFEIAQVCLGRKCGASTSRSSHIFPRDVTQSILSPD
jgi:hypothetical protein